MDVAREFLPIPDRLDIVGDQDTIEEAHSITQEPTASHALAMADHEEKGAAQTEHDSEVKDLGWTAPESSIANPLVGGLSNEELWMLVRRFNMQMYHVKDYPYPVPGNLDLNIADEEEFSPDKLRAGIERLYMTVGVGLLSLVKHIVRLRSWRETRRTAYFCAAYTVAWLFDLLGPLFALTAIALIVHPPTRELLFPPAPLALVDSKTGGVQKPKAGVLGSTDSATGAPENYKGEAVEAEASSFVNSIASVALSSISGKHPQGDPTAEDEKEGTLSKSAPDPTALAVSASSARDTVAGGDKGKSHKAKVPMETVIWNKMRPIMHGIADVSDTWERLGNALSPTPPFPQDFYRLRLASILVPLFAASFFINSYMIVKGVTFGVGFGFFGDPIISPALHWLNTNYPNWPKLLEMRNTLLKGVPTNAQLTITLLRIGEANKAPLPPPPQSNAPPPDESVELSEANLRAAGADYPLNATEEELQAALQHDPIIKHTTDGGDVDAAKTQHHGKAGSKLLGALKLGVRGGVDTLLGADRLKATVGSEHAKQRLGVLPSDKDRVLSGPVDFKCRYHGRKGRAYISVRATIPCVSFSLDKPLGGPAVNLVSSDDTTDQVHPVWSVAVAEIKELKKLGGLGWKTKLIVGWALNREVADGLEIVDKQGNRWVVTAMPLRDQLFNRLIAMGGQKWEAW